MKNKLDFIVIQALAALARSVECNDDEETGRDDLQLRPLEISPDWNESTSVKISPTTMALILGAMAKGLAEAYEYHDADGPMGPEALECPSVILQNCPFSGREDPFDIDGPEGERALVDRASDALDELFR